ncbi:hypothetical protein ABIC08_009302, partial [Bradyrhizobium sp. RT9b]|uniref:hypothetical protein n=1 Tax=unclassified Bradyrhizobium TaxID=2631580 RepID=UPI00339830DE
QWSSEPRHRPAIALGLPHSVPQSRGLITTLTDYRAFTNDSLTMMYESIRGALASDDAQKAAGEQPRFKVRETSDWKAHAANLETEMLRRGMFFEIIDWSEDQAQLPL